MTICLAISRVAPQASQWKYCKGGGVARVLPPQSVLQCGAIAHCLSMTIAIHHTNELIALHTEKTQVQPQTQPPFDSHGSSHSTTYSMHTHRSLPFHSTPYPAIASPGEQNCLNIVCVHTCAQHTVYCRRRSGSGRCKSAWLKRVLTYVHSHKHIYAE